MSQACAANRDQDAADDYRKQLSALHLKIIQTQLDQNADAARIESRIASAEKEIAWLQKRPLAFEELQKAILASRDRAVLSIRDVRKNMQHRAFKAIQMQGWLEDYVSKRLRFAEDDQDDERLRMRLFELLARTATSALPDHLQEAAQAGDMARVELIRIRVPNSQ